MSADRTNAHLTRADLRRLPVRLLRPGTSYKADLFLCDVGQEPVLVKDYERKTGIWRWIGAIGISHEAHALQALQGVDGVPRYLGRPDRCCVAMSFVPGRRARKADPKMKDNEAFVRQLEQLVARMHARGVVHLDLKHRSNLLVSEQGRPVVLDFESALCFNANRALGRLLVRLLGSLDRLAVLNWKRRLCPHLFTAAQMRKATLLHRLRKLWLPRRIVDGLLTVLAGRKHGSTSRSGPASRRTRPPNA